MVTLHDGVLAMGPVTVARCTEETRETFRSVTPPDRAARRQISGRRVVSAPRSSTVRLFTVSGFTTTPWKWGLSPP
jgi:hypothetical protein